MKDNQTLKEEVMQAIRVEPLLRGASIDVHANQGIIILSGTVDSYVKKRAAEQISRMVLGVHAVVERIKVEFESADKKTDQTLESEIVEILKLSPNIAKETINLLVEDGCVTLMGEVKSLAQKEEAERVIYKIEGVNMITNAILVQSESEDDLEKKIIQDELGRNWAIDDQAIVVSVVGNQVTLKGKVHSLYQSDTAERIAWNAPGVHNVHNRLKIE